MMIDMVRASSGIETRPRTGRLSSSELAERVGEVREGTDERGVDVGGGLGLLVVGALVGEPVVLVGPADDGANEDVGIGGGGFHEVEALGALDLGRVGGDGREG